MRHLRHLSHLLKTVLWTLTAAVALAVSLIYHLQLPLAHRIERQLLNRFATGEIRGELSVGRLDRLDFKKVDARFVTVRDGEGRRIISADRVELVPDIRAIVKTGTIRFRFGRITGAVARLADKDGEPSLFTTFDARHPSKTPSTKEPLHVQVDSLELVDTTIYGQVIKLRGVRAEHLHARGRFVLARELEVVIEEAQGVVVQPFDFPGRIISLTGTISTDKMRGIKLDVRAGRDDEDVRAQIDYRSDVPDRPQNLYLELLTDKLTPATLRSVGYAFAGPLSAPLNGRLVLNGPPDLLELSAQVQSRAGAAAVSGTISSDAGISVRVTTQSMALDQLMDGAPAVNARGQLDVTAKDDAQPRLHAEFAAMRYRAILVPPFVLDGTLEDNGVRIERARALRGGQISLRGRIGFDGHTDLRLDAHFTALERDPNLSQVAGDLQGQLNAAVQIKTPDIKHVTELDITGKVELVDAHFGSVRAARVSMTGSARGDPQLPRLDVQVTAEEFAILSYQLGSAHFSLQGGPRNYAARGEFQAAGKKTFSFDAAVEADRNGFVVQADPIEFSVGTESWRGLLRDFRVIHDQSIELGFLRLASRAQRLEATGILRLHGEDSLQAQLQNFDLTAVRAVLGNEFPLVHGYADANLTLRGDTERPIVSFQGAVRAARLPGAEQFDAEYNVSYGDGDLELDSSLELPSGSGLQLSGHGFLDATQSDTREALASGSYDLTLSANNMDARMIPQLHDRIESGRISGSMHGKGGRNELALDGELTGSGVRFAHSQPIELTAAFQYAHDQLATRLGLADEHGPLARGELSSHVNWQRLQAGPREYLPELLDSDFSLSGQSLARALDEFPVTIRGANSWPLRFASTFKASRSAGVLQGDLHGVFKPKELLSDSACQLTTASELLTNWQVQNERASTHFEARLDDRAVASADGQIDWSFAGFLRGEQVPQPRAELHGGADIAQVERVPGLCQHGRGELHGQWDIRSVWTDTPTADIALHGTLIPEVRVQDGATEQRVAACRNQALQLAIDAHADAHGAKVDVQQRGCGGGPGLLHAQLPWNWNAQHASPVLDDKRESRLDLDLQDTELAPLLDYLPGVLGFSGQASGQLEVRAQRNKVAYTGDLALSGGRLYLLSTGQDLSEVGLGITGYGTWLKLDNLHARVGRGSIDAQGGIGLEGFWPRRLQFGVVLRELALQREGIELARLNGSMAVVSEIRADHTDTAIKLHSLAIRLPDVSARSPQSLESHPDITVTSEERKTVNGSPYVFRFELDGRRGLSAKRNDFDATLAAELRVEYDQTQLRVGGYIEFVRGTFDVFGKRFQVNRGSMHFAGSDDLSPEVSLVATHDPDQVGGSPVLVNVSGSLSKPEVTFLSEACPGEGAVVLLLSGRCPSDTESGIGNPNATQDALAAGILGGIVTLGARSQLGGLIPRFAVESTAGGTRTRLKAGFEAVPKFMRSLVQRVYLQGAVSTADSGAGDTTGGGTQSATTPDFLIELYFPNSIVGAGRVAPTTRSWGLDVTWEP
jgi:autotransporter translocation and assembly factor TamB